MASRPPATAGGCCTITSSLARLASCLRARLDRTLDAAREDALVQLVGPRDLYALYLRRGLTDRAMRFRVAMKTAVSFDMEYYFDQVDKSPATFAP